MTEFWKSNKMHWCDICKCWMNDTKQAILNHERGMGHQDKLKKKLRDMAKKADQDKKDAANLDKSLSQMEEAAQKQYEADQRAAAAAAEASNGKWTWSEDSGYYYNARFRWYYDPKTEWYYGGGPPPEWAQSPAESALPSAARFGAAPHEAGPVPQRAAATAGPVLGTAGAGVAGGGGSRGASTSGATARAGANTVALNVPSHPQAMIGGHAGPTIGRVGAAKGLTDVGGSASTSTGATPAQKAVEAAAKRKREDGKPMSAADAEALARREAARARVAQRTAQGYGFV